MIKLSVEGKDFFFFTLSCALCLNCTQGTVLKHNGILGFSNKLTYSSTDYLVSIPDIGDYLKYFEKWNFMNKNNANVFHIPKWEF